MIPLGLTAREQRAFHRALRTEGYTLDVEVELLTMSEKHVTTLNNIILGGQIVVSGDEFISRSLQMTMFANPETGINPDRPEEAVYLNRMLSVTYGVWVDEINRWVRVPVFRGPIVKASLDGNVLDIEALGKAHLMRGESGFTKVYRAGLKRTNVIRDIARRSGERNMVIPDWSPKTGKKTVMVKVGPMSRPWTWMRIPALSMRGQIFYDGAGTLRLRKVPVRPSWTFTPDQLLSEPKVTVDDEQVFNRVLVKGQPPEGKKGVVEAEGEIPRSHANSPFKLGRNGWHRNITDVIEDSDIRTNKDARAARDRRLREILQTTLSVEFNCKPVPHLDANDVAYLDWSEWNGEFRVSEYTLPLMAGEPMAVGYRYVTRRHKGFFYMLELRARNRARGRTRNR